MKVKTFWNNAFLASLARLPVNEAKLEADRATELCIRQWQFHATDWVEPGLTRWQDQKITDIREPAEGGLNPQSVNAST